MPGGHWSGACRSGSWIVFIVFGPNSLFILLTVLTAYNERERDNEIGTASRSFEPMLVSFSCSSHWSGGQEVTCDCCSDKKGRIKHLWDYVYSTGRWNRKRGRKERTVVLLQRIQIYPAAVLPNMQDLFMSVSISASHLQMQSAAKTPRHSVALCATCRKQIIVKGTMTRLCGQAAS